MAYIDTVDKLLKLGISCKHDVHDTCMWKADYGCRPFCDHMDLDLENLLQEIYERGWCFSLYDTEFVENEEALRNGQITLGYCCDLSTHTGDIGFESVGETVVESVAEALLTLLKEYETGE